jgi:hypothetical protein
MPSAARSGSRGYDVELASDGAEALKHQPTADRGQGWSHTPETRLRATAACHGTMSAGMANSSAMSSF